jgi:hypothetical protein
VIPPERKGRLGGTVTVKEEEQSMPRGNDSAAAGKELSARLGGMRLNAEEMIERNAARWPAALRAANGRPVDWDATEALSDEVAERAVAPDSVLSYAVRGEYLVVVSDDRDGFTTKRAFLLDDTRQQAVVAPPPARQKTTGKTGSRAARRPRTRK